MAANTNLKAWEWRRKPPDGIVHFQVSAVHRYAAVATTEAKLSPSFSNSFEDGAEAEASSIIDPTCDAGLEGFVNGINGFRKLSILRIRR